MMSHLSQATMRYASHCAKPQSTLASNATHNVLLGTLARPLSRHVSHSAPCSFSRKVNTILMEGIEQLEKVINVHLGGARLAHAH